MNLIKSVKALSKVQIAIWLISLLAISISFVVAQGGDYLTLLASLIGATSLIFIAKGDAVGQLLMVGFALLYAFISWRFRYYGEMITYVGMTLPTAIMAMVNWLKNPYAEREVKVREMTWKIWLGLLGSAIPVTLGMGLMLAYFDTANLFFSTISITTSYVAAMLMVYRSPYYALGYACNDLILIVLWILATLEDIAYLPMVICFGVFLVNDLYGYCNWQVMRKRQLGRKGEEHERERIFA